MNCRGCGTEVDDPNLDAVNQAVDEVLLASIDDAREKGGVCPLCGHSHYVPFYNRESFRTAVLLGIWLTVGAILAVTWYTRSPIRTSLAQGMIARARHDSRVQAALGTPIHVGLLASGGITTDETGWSEAKLSIPLNGPKHSAMLRVIAGRGEGPWVISTIEIWVEGEAQPINLMRGRVEVTTGQGYQSVHTQPAVEPVMMASAASAPASDGTYPVVRCVYTSAARGRGARYFGSLVNRETHFRNEPEDFFEVDLRSGTFVLRRTDLYVPDAIPLTLTRVFHTWGNPNWRRDGNWAYAWNESHPAFGAGFTHAYDICPMGTRNPYTYMDLYMADGNAIHLGRISRGTGYADAWYEQTDLSSEFYKARLWWNGNGWTLRLEDGTLYLFPESYNGRNLAQGAPFEMRDAQGRRLQLIRDTHRNLRRLVSPSSRTISLEYNDAGYVTRAQDDQGHSIDYSYDREGRLISVHDSTGPHFQYVYDWRQLDKLVAVKDGNGLTLLKNTYYDDGRVATQVAADGSEYRFHYVLDGEGKVAQTTVTWPDRSETALRFQSGVLISKN